MKTNTLDAFLQSKIAFQKLTADIDPATEGATTDKSVWRCGGYSVVSFLPYWIRDHAGGGDRELALYPPFHSFNKHRVTQP